MLTVDIKNFMEEIKMEERNEQFEEKKETEQKEGFFTKMGKGLADAGKEVGKSAFNAAKWTNKKIGDGLSKIDNKLFIKEAFNKDSKVFTVIYKNAEKKKINALNLEGDQILQTVKAIPNVFAIDRVIDANKQSYCNIQAFDIKFPYEKQLDGKVITKELFQYKYSTIQPE